MGLIVSTYPSFSAQVETLLEEEELSERKESRNLNHFHFVGLYRMTGASHHRPGHVIFHKMIRMN